METFISLHAQGGFEWGMAENKLEPSKEQVSLSLAGYGLPREGRFSIYWKQIKPVPAIVGAGSYDDRLVLVNDEGTLLFGDTLQGTGFTSLSNQIKNVTGIASAPGLIYLLTKNEIVKANVKKRKLRLQGKISLGNTGIVHIVVHRGKLYGISNDDLWYTFERNATWRPLGKVEKIRSVASVENYIYALKTDGTLWYGLPNEPASWKQNGTKNGYTWKEPLRAIIGIRDNLFALSNSGELFKAVHSSDSSLSVSSLVIRKNGKTVTIIGVDVCGLHYAFTKSLKDSLKKRFDIASEGIMINSSHTHFAPVTQEWKAWAPYYHTPDSSYLFGVVQPAIIGAVEKAIGNLSPGNFSFVRGTTSIGANRRPQANQQMPYDSSLDIIMLKHGQNELKGLLYLTGCHPVFPNEKESSFTLSANYPGVTRKILQERLGIDHSLFLQGCGGDINPVKSDYRQTGKDLGEDILAAMKNRAVALEGEIAYRFDSLLLPVKFWSREKILAFREENQQLGADVYAEKNVRWANIMLEHLEKGTVPQNMPIYIQTIAIGNWQLVGLSREVVTEYGMNIKKQWPGKLISVAGYCNDVSSYLPVGWHIRTKVYEGYDSFFWYAQPNLFPENILDLVMEKVHSIVL